MNANEHPTIDQIADREAGLSSEDDARAIAAHLAGCSECSNVVSRLAEVRDLLAGAGRAEEPIPVDVARALDDAVATVVAEREAGVPSLSERRAQSGAGGNDTPASMSRRRTGRWMLGAAAAVAVFAVGGAVVSNGLPGESGDEDAASAGSSADQSAPEFAPGGGTADGKVGTGTTPKLDESNVDQYAAALEAGRAQAVRAARTRCGLPVPSAGQDLSSSRSTNSLVMFDGIRAVLSVDRAQRRLIVYACPGPARVLYRSSY